jgi:hypothetical protein
VTGGGALERRYRLLLSCYPRAHRAEYGDEMLGVLMADGSGRWPGRTATADLLVGAGRAWLGRSRRRATTGRWSGAVPLLGLVLPFALALASLPIYWTIFRFNWVGTQHHWRLFVDQQPLMLTWAVVLALAFTRLRRVTALVAWLCAVTQALLAVHLIASDLFHGPLHSGRSACWPLVMLLAAAALTVVALREGESDGGARGAAAMAVRRLGPVATTLLLLTVVLFSRNDVFDLGSLFVLGIESVGRSAAWWLAWAIVFGVPLPAVVALARRAGLPVALRIAALGLGVFFAGGGRIGDLLLILGADSQLGYVVSRWFVVPLLSFAVVALAARLLERRRSAGAGDAVGNG